MFFRNFQVVIRAIRLVVFKVIRFYFYFNLLIKLNVLVIILMVKVIIKSIVFLLYFL